MPDTRHYILQRAARHFVVKHFRYRKRRQVVLPRTKTQKRFLCNVISPPMAGDDHMEVVMKGFFELAGYDIGIRLAQEQASISTPESQKAFRMRADLLP